MPAEVISWSSSPFSASRSVSVLGVHVGLVAHGLSLGALFHPPLLILGGPVRVEDRFGFQVPALPALGRPQGFGSLGAGRTDRSEGVPAGHEHLLDGAGVEVGPAQLHGANAGAVLDGQVLDDLTGERNGQPLGAGPSRYVQLGLLGGRNEGAAREVTQ